MKLQIVQGGIIQMMDPQKKQKLLFSRAQHQIRQIQFSCREVVALSQQIALFAHEVGQTELNSKKIEYLKGQIKDKLKQFAGNIDQIYKILDRKLVILSRQITKQLTNKANISTSASQSNQSLNRPYTPQKQILRSVERTHNQPSFDHDRQFSDTLNPRITQLQARIADYEQREAMLNSKISELKTKNQQLLQQFNRLSSASSKKINELSCELNSRLQKQKDTFTSIDTNDAFKHKVQEKSIRHLSFNSAQELPNSGNRQKKRPSLYSEADAIFQFDFDGKNTKKEEKLKSLAFGCMPSNKKAQVNLSLTPAKLAGVDKVQNLDKNDKNRRFDLLLNRLRDSETDGKKKPQEKRTEDVNESFKSILSEHIVKRYQI